MKNQQKVNISYSCSEDENKMASLGENTKFCFRCQKKVIDFRGITELKIEKPVCGIFSSNQVNKIQRKSVIKNLSLPISIATLLGVSLLPLNLIGQEKAPKTISEKSNQSIFKIKGTLIDEYEKEKLPFVNIHLLHQNKEIHNTSTDFDGNFTLEIDTVKYPLQNLELAVNFIGYQNDTIDIPISGNLIIELESSADFEYIQVTKGYVVHPSFSNDSTEIEKINCKSGKKRKFRKRKNK